MFKLLSDLVHKLSAGVCACVCLHVDVRRLEAALVDVVVCEGLRGVGAVLVHRDGHFAMSHPFRRLDMRRRSFTGIQQ